MIGLTIDPGLETGMCLFEYGDEEAFHVKHLWQFGEGAEGLAAMLKRLDLQVWPTYLTLGPYQVSNLIVERFTPRPNENFAPTRKSVEPLRGEGVLLGLALGPHIQWREPSQQYFMSPPDTPLTQKKKDARAFLETNGIKPTGSSVGRPNADDAISATLHSISWLRAQRHMPTLRKFFPPATPL